MTILIVDDERTIRKALGFALRKSGYDTIEARNAAEALEWVEISKFDLMIVDWSLPGISGIEFIKMLRNGNKNYPSIILTSQNILAQEFSNDEIKPKKYISKDLPISSILKEIDTVLNLL